MERDDGRRKAPQGISRQAMDYDRRLLTYTCFGEVDQDRARTVILTACRQASEMGFGLLFDLRESTLHVPLEETVEMLGEPKNLWRWVHRVALVGKGSANMEWIRFVCGAAANAGIVAQCFEAPDIARQWCFASAADPLEGVPREVFKILVVDDDPDVLELTMRVLAGAGYQVRGAGSGEECLVRAEAEVPDLVLLDVVMPGLEGLEVCRRLKAIPGLSKTYVVFVSGVRTEVEDQKTGLDSGADGYIPRPIGNQELVARTEVLLWKRASDLSVGS